MTRFTWIVFDVGNVLVQVTDEGLCLLAKSLGVSPGDLRDYAEKSGLQARANVGDISPDEYVRLVNGRFGSSFSVADIVNTLSRDIGLQTPGIMDVLRPLHAGYRLAALSDTFFGHWESFKLSPIAREFDQLIASHEIGFTKSDPRTFRKVLAILRAEPPELLFVDDSHVNIQTAESCGITGFRASSKEEILVGLRAHGCL